MQLDCEKVKNGLNANTTESDDDKASQLAQVAERAQKRLQSYCITKSAKRKDVDYN